MGRPGCDDIHNTPFCNACTNCTQTRSPFERVSRDGVTTILMDLFISSTNETVLNMDNLVTYIFDYPNSQQLIFDRNLAKYEKVRIKKLLFQLITFEILTVVYSTTREEMIFQLSRTGSNVNDLSIHSNEAWDNVPTLFGDDSDDDMSDSDDMSERDDISM